MTKYVLMLEEDSDDRYLTSETLKELGIEIPVQYLSESKDLFDFLSRADKPSVILIDFNTVPEDGLSILKKIKSDPAYNDIPVVILSDSDNPRYRNACYLNGASSYIKKPNTDSATREKIGTFFKYWFEVAEV